eukprot:gene18237-21819_t
MDQISIIANTAAEAVDIVDSPPSIDVDNMSPVIVSKQPNNKPTLTFVESPKKSSGPPPSIKRSSNGEIIIDFQITGQGTIGTTYPVPSRLTPDIDTAIEMFRRRQGRIDSDSNWTFSIANYHEVMREFESWRGRGMRLLIKRVPPQVFSFIQDPWHVVRGFVPKPPPEVFDESRIPANVLAALLPFQLRGVHFGVQQRGKCLIADEMGLGKTIQALAIASYYKSHWPILIVCPSSLVPNWAKEVERWFPDLMGHVAMITSSDRRADSLINIISYGLVSKMYETELVPREFKSIICDESHYLKNPNSKRTAAALKLIKSATIRILLTGTPALSRPIELYPQLTALESPIFGTMEEFGLRYCNAFKGRFGWDYTGNSHLPELHALLANRPDIIKKIGEKGVESERTRVLKLYLETGRAKLAGAQDYVSKLVKDKKKFLVFAHHSEILNGLESTLKSLDVTYIRIDGSTPSQTRQNNVTRFQNNEKCTVALLSITAAGTGLTLTSAALVVFAELYWTPGVLRQAEDRVHRIGQREDVHIHYLIGKNTLDDRIWPIICNKLEVLGETLDGQEEILHTKHLDLRGTLSNESIEEYLDRKAEMAIDVDDDEQLFSLIGDDPTVSAMLAAAEAKKEDPDDMDEEMDGNKAKKNKVKQQQQHVDPPPMPIKSTLYSKHISNSSIFGANSNNSSYQKNSNFGNGAGNGSFKFHPYTVTANGLVAKPIPVGLNNYPTTFASPKKQQIPINHSTPGPFDAIDLDEVEDIEDDFHTAGALPSSRKKAKTIV